MLVFRVSTTSDQTPRQLAADIATFGRTIEDLRPYWPDVMREARGFMAQAIGSEGATTASGAWPALNKAYSDRKQRRFPGVNMLHRTGRLLSSLAGDKEQTIRYFPLQMSFESNVPYGGYHQDGAGRLPRRAPWNPTEKQMAKLVDIVTKGLRRSVSRIGRRPFILSGSV